MGLISEEDQLLLNEWSDHLDNLFNTTGAEEAAKYVDKIALEFKEKPVSFIFKASYLTSIGDNKGIIETIVALGERFPQFEETVEKTMLTAYGKHVFSHDYTGNTETGRAIQLLVEDRLGKEKMDGVYASIGYARLKRSGYIQ